MPKKSPSKRTTRTTKVEVDRIINGKWGNTGMQYFHHPGSNPGHIQGHSRAHIDHGWRLPTSPTTVTLEQYNRGERPWEE